MPLTEEQRLRMEENKRKALEKRNLTLVCSFWYENQVTFTEIECTVTERLQD